MSTDNAAGREPACLFPCLRLCSPSGGGRWRVGFLAKQTGNAVGLRVVSCRLWIERATHNPQLFTLNTQHGGAHPPRRECRGFRAKDQMKTLRILACFLVALLLFSPTGCVIDEYDDPYWEDNNREWRYQRRLEREREQRYREREAWERDRHRRHMEEEERHRRHMEEERNRQRMEEDRRRRMEEDRRRMEEDRQRRRMEEERNQRRIEERERQQRHMEERERQQRHMEER